MTVRVREQAVPCFHMDAVGGDAHCACDVRAREGTRVREKAGKEREKEME